MMNRLMGLSFLAMAAASISGAARAEPTVLRTDANACCLPLLQGILIDPARRAEIPNNDSGLDRLVAQIQAERRALPEAKDKTLVSKRLFDALSVQAAYWQLKDDGSDPSARPLREKAQRDLLAFAPAALRLIADPAQKQRALFPVAMTQYLINPKSARRTLESVEVTDPMQADLLGFVRGLDALDLGRTDDVRTLEDKAGRIGKKASLVSALQKAKALSAIGEGYRSELLYASRLCEDLSPAERANVFRYSMGVWTRAKDFQGRWEPVPFQVTCFEKTSGFAALLENLALYAKSQGRLDKSIAYYSGATQLAGLETEKADLSQKLAEVHRLAYQRDARRDSYQAFLIQAESRFHSLPQGVRFLQMHDELLRSELSAQIKKEPKVEDLLDARVVYNRYLAAAAASPGARRVRSDWVELLERHKQYDEAVDSLLSLAKGSSGIVREKYLRQALALQSLSLKVDIDSPWTFPKSNDARQLARLGSLMDFLAPFNRDKVGFQITRGLVAGQLGLAAEARSRFRKLLPNASNERDRNELFTSLLLAAIVARDHADVESLIDQSMRQSYRLTSALPENQSLKDLYTETIVTEIHEHFSHSRWTEARQKIDKALTFLPDDSQRLQILYLKARTCQNQGLYADALESLDRIQASKIWDATSQQALLDKASLQLAQGNLEASTQTYELYLARFATGDRIADVRRSLVDLYLGLGRPDSARLQLLVLMKSEDLDGDQQVILSEKLVTLHRQLMKDDELKADIAFYQKLGFENRSALAQLLNILIKRNPALVGGEGSFAAEDKTVAAVVDFLSEAALIRAKALAANAFAKVQESYKNPVRPPIENLRTVYQGLVQSFLKACEPPSASHCAPSVAELRFEAKRYQQWLDQSEAQGANDGTREMQAYFTKERAALDKQLDDAIARGSNDRRWLHAHTLENSSLWRFMGLGSQDTDGSLDVPQGLQSQNSFNFSQGVN